MAPAPYCPLGISPSNSRYSSGCSSVAAAKRLSLGASGIPLGIAQQASTPSRSRRRGVGLRPGRRLGLEGEVALGAIARQPADGRALAGLLAPSPGRHLQLRGGPRGSGLLRRGLLRGGLRGGGLLDLGGALAGRANRVEARLQRAHQVGCRLARLLARRLEG